MVASGLHPELIREPAGVQDVCTRAAAAGVVAIDTESDSLHSYFHKLCLIQVSFAGDHFVLDPLVLTREELRPLVQLLAEPKVEKVLHGADYDLRVLDRDLGARVVHLRDTQVAAQLLGEPLTGLAALIEREAGVTLDKKFQRADWGHRPLTPELLEYAAGDTAHLALLRSRLAEKLAGLGRLPWWEEECAALEAVRWEEPAPDPLAFERIKGARKLAAQARDRLAALHLWREREAAAADVPPFRIMNAEVLLVLAQNPPADLAALGEVRGVGRSTVRRFGREILYTVSQAPPAPDRTARTRFTLDRVREARIKQARAARDAVAGALAIEPGVLGSRAALEAVVDRQPCDEEELRGCLARAWRTALLAPVLLPLVASWRAAGPRDAHPA